MLTKFQTTQGVKNEKNSYFDIDSIDYVAFCGHTRRMQWLLA